MEEIWKDICGHNSLYQISNLGMVRSTESRVLINKKLFIKKRIKVLKLTKTKGGYLAVTIGIKNNKKTYLTHRLVAIHFLENEFFKKCVNHKDLNKTNNNVLNLEWTTHKENTIHFFKKGNPYNRFGKNNGRSKKIIDLKTLIIYDTINDAIKTVDFSQPYLSMMLSGKRKNKTSLQFYKK
jgi:hypothetical protein